MLIVQSKWEQSFIFSVASTPRKNYSLPRFYSLKSKFSHIEIWENTGDLMTPNYQEELLDDSDHHQFFTYDYGEIIRINHDQCELSNP